MDSFIHYQLRAQQSAGHWRHKISVPQGLGLGPEPKVLMNGLVWPGQISSSVRQWSLRCLPWEPFSLLLFSTPGFPMVVGLYHPCSWLTASSHSLVHQMMIRAFLIIA